MILRTLTLLFIFAFGLSQYAWSGWSATTSPNGPTHAIYNYAAKSKIYGAFDIKGISFSATQGNAWQFINDGLPQNATVWDITSIGTTLFAATDNGVYLSTNDGSKWTAAINNLGNLNDYHFAVSGNTLYVSTADAGLYKTTDKGSTWTNLNAASDIQLNITSIAVSGSTVYAGTQYGKIYRTTDAGTTWENISQGIVVDVTSLSITTGEIYAGTYGNGIFVSKDAGSTWSPVNSGLSSDNLFVNVLLADSNKLIAATKGGIILTENKGNSWADVSQELASKEILSLETDNKFMYAGGKDIPVYRRDLSEIIFPELNPPVLTSPANQSVATDTSVTFTWNPSNGAVSYHFQLSKASDFSSIVADRDGLKSTVQTESALEPSTKYYWHVAANSSDLQKKWSETWYFVTKGPLSAPVIISPASDTTKTIDIPVELKWSKGVGASSYKILIATDEEFNSIAIDSSNIIDTVFYAGDLNEHTVYYWKVASVNDLGENELSEVRLFKTGIKLSAEDSPVALNYIHMSAYPNPASGTINININSAWPGNVELVISDMAGKESSVIFNGFKDSGNLEVPYNVSGFAPGVYNLILKMKNYKLGSKIVIVR